MDCLHKLYFCPSSSLGDQNRSRKEKNSQDLTWQMTSRHLSLRLLQCQLKTSPGNMEVAAAAAEAYTHHRHKYYPIRNHRRLKVKAQLAQCNITRPDLRTSSFRLGVYLQSFQSSMQDGSPPRTPARRLHALTRTYHCPQKNNTRLREFHRETITTLPFCLA
jgi:hypothetical protein